MKKKLQIVLMSLVSLLFAFCTCVGCESGEPKNYVLTEQTYFHVMENMLKFPEQYLGSTIELDCFVYEITDAVSGEKIICGVRLSSSAVGCTCGNDKITGFILNYDGTIPAARNQSDKESNDKAWIHIKGTLTDTDKRYISVFAYANGQATDTVEQIAIYSFTVETLEEIDGTGHAQYVTK